THIAFQNPRNTEMKNPRTFAAVLVAAFTLLFAVLIWATSSAAAQSSKGAGLPIKNNPDDLTTPLREGFESGNLDASAFRSAVATCTPGGCGWSAVTTDKHAGGYSAFAPNVAAVSDQRLVLDNAIAI